MGNSKLNAIPKQALVVEDDPAVRKLVGSYLKALQFAVMEAPDGKKGMAALAEGKFDLLVLDLMLPESSGYDVLDYLRKEGKKLPVLMISARGLPEDRATAEELGATLYLIKPFSRTDFSRAVKSIVEVKA